MPSPSIATMREFQLDRAAAQAVGTLLDSTLPEAEREAALRRHREISIRRSALMTRPQRRPNT